jgi:hypothetical protein
VVIVFRDRTHHHRPGFDPGAGVVYIVRGLHAEEVAFARLTHERRLGLGGIGQPGGPGAGDAHFVLHVVVAQAGLPILAGPGDPEAQGCDLWHLDGHRRSTGVLHHVEGLCGLVAGAVGSGDGQGGAEGVVGVEGIGVGAGPGDGTAQAVSRPGVSRLGEGQAEEAGQGVGRHGGEGEDAAPLAVVDGVPIGVGVGRLSGQGQPQAGSGLVYRGGDHIPGAELLGVVAGADLEGVGPFPGRLVGLLRLRHANQQIVRTTTNQALQVIAVHARAGVRVAACPAQGPIGLILEGGQVLHADGGRDGIDGDGRRHGMWRDLAQAIRGGGGVPADPASVLHFQVVLVILDDLEMERATEGTEMATPIAKRRADLRPTHPN